MNNSNITFLIQGAEKKPGYRDSLVKSIIKFYEGCQIVIVDLVDRSLDQNIKLVSKKIHKNTEITYVISKDPGPILKKPKPVQVNRQIIGAQAGIRFANRKYIYKIRPELKIISNNLIKHINSSINNKEYERYLICDAITSKNPFLYWPNGKYHISDWSYLGSKKVIEDLFNIPLASINDFSNQKYELAPESYVMQRFITKRVNEELRDSEIKDYLNLLLENIFILQPKDLGIKAQHFPYRYPFGLNIFIGLTSMEYKKYFEERYKKKYPFLCSKNLIPTRFRKIIFYPRYILTIIYVEIRKLIFKK